MNELHLQNPTFRKLAWCITFSVEHSHMRAIIHLPVIIGMVTERTCVWRLYLFTTDGVGADNMIWYSIPIPQYSFYSFGCFEEYFKNETYEKIILNKNEIYE